MFHDFSYSDKVHRNSMFLIFPTALFSQLFYYLKCSKILFSYTVGDKNCEKIMKKNTEKFLFFSSNFAMIFVSAEAPGVFFS